MKVRRRVEIVIEKRQIAIIGRREEEMTSPDAHEALVKAHTVNANPSPARFQFVKEWPARALRRFSFRKKVGDK